MAWRRHCCGWPQCWRWTASLMAPVCRQCGALQRKQSPTTRAVTRQRIRQHGKCCCSLQLCWTMPVLAEAFANEQRTQHKAELVSQGLTRLVHAAPPCCLAQATGWASRAWRNSATSHGANTGSKMSTTDRQTRRVLTYISVGFDIVTAPVNGRFSGWLLRRASGPASRRSRGLCRSGLSRSR